MPRIIVVASPPGRRRRASLPDERRGVMRRAILLLSADPVVGLFVRRGPARSGGVPGPRGFDAGARAPVRHQRKRRRHQRGRRRRAADGGDDPGRQASPRHPRQPRRHAALRGAERLADCAARRRREHAAARRQEGGRHRRGQRQGPEAAARAAGRVRSRADGGDRRRPAPVRGQRGHGAGHGALGGRRHASWPRSRWAASPRAWSCGPTAASST